MLLYNQLGVYLHLRESMHVNSADIRVADNQGKTYYNLLTFPEKMKA